MTEIPYEDPLKGVDADRMRRMVTAWVASEVELSFRRKGRGYEAETPIGRYQVSPQDGVWYLTDCYGYEHHNFFYSAREAMGTAMRHYLDVVLRAMNLQDYE